MHKITLRNLGPIENCSINLNELIVLTGPQANGKSTVAKAVYFFRTIKDDILDMMLRGTTGEKPEKWKVRLTKRLKDKFMQLFGSSYGMSNDMEAKYEYAPKTYIRVYLKPNYKNDGGPNYVTIEFSRKIGDYLFELDSHVFTDMTAAQREREEAKLSELFEDAYETVFIPAGRSMITLLTTQLNFIFTSMSESQKRSIDYCTQRYVELILRLKPSFAHGIEGLLSDQIHLTQKAFNIGLAKKCKQLIESIIKGRYQYENGEEKLYIGDRQNKQYVKINFASSGQQETVWITNILFYYLLENKPVFLIVEEPESHLYPDSQKLIAELLALFKSNGNTEMITTHSPYILGEMNNLIYADVLCNRGVAGVENIIDRAKQLDPKKVSSYHVCNGVLEDAKDGEMGLIRNELIDGASIAITDECDALYDLSTEEA